MVLYSILGGGHTWPGSPITLSTGTFGPTTEQIDATGLMLAFFDHHRRPTADRRPDPHPVGR